jgi:hypothetical protein
VCVGDSSTGGGRGGGAERGCVGDNSKGVGRRAAQEEGVCVCGRQ